MSSKDAALALLLLGVVLSAACAHSMEEFNQKGWTVIASEHFEMLTPVAPEVGSSVLAAVEDAHALLSSTFLRDAAPGKWRAVLLDWPEPLERTAGVVTFRPRNSSRPPRAAVVQEDTLLVMTTKMTRARLLETLSFALVRSTPRRLASWFELGFSRYVRTAYAESSAGRRIACFGLVGNNASPLGLETLLRERRPEHLARSDRASWIAVDYMFHGSGRGLTEFVQSAVAFRRESPQKGDALVNSFPAVGHLGRGSDLIQHANTMERTMGAERGPCPLGFLLPSTGQVSVQHASPGARAVHALVREFRDRALDGMEESRGLSATQFIKMIGKLGARH
jgi:hypothetical protein